MWGMQNTKRMMDAAKELNAGTQNFGDVVMTSPHINSWRAEGNMSFAVVTGLLCRY